MWRLVKENSTALGTAAIAVGGLLYVVLTFIARWVYAPLGVKPAEVGLGYGPLLVGTAIALPLILAVSLATVGLALAVSWIAAKLASTLGRAWFLLLVALFAVALVALVALGDAHPAVTVYAAVLILAAVIGGLAGGSLRTNAILGLVILLVTVGGGLIDEARRTRHDLERGYSPRYGPWGTGPWATPWDASVARVFWASPEARGPRLPPCVLYLGEANGVSVFYDPGPLDGPLGRESWLADRARTLRLPTSSVVVEIHPNLSAASPIEREPVTCVRR